MTLAKGRFVVGFAALVSCGAHPAGRVALGEETYKLNCDRSLGDCLEEYAGVCSVHGYDVVRAKQEVSRTGVPPVESEFVRSEAIIRCRTGIEGGRVPRAAAASGKGSPKPGACFPGSTQACLGPGACAGAQTCKQDGKAFGPCDCGESKAETPAVPVEGDAGPPSTWTVPGDGGVPLDGGPVP